MNFKLVTSLNKGLYENKAQKIINSSIGVGYNIDLYHENSYEDTEVSFPKEVNLLDLWNIPEYSFWIKSFVDSKNNPWNIESLHGNVLKKQHAKFWFRKVLSVVHAVLNSNTDYTIWVDGDVFFTKKLDEKFWSFVSKHDICCIMRDTLHIESGFVVYKNNDKIKRLMREYLGFYTSGDVWKYPRWCDGSVLSYTVENNPYLKVGRFKHPSMSKPGTSSFGILEYIHHIKAYDGFAKTRNKQANN